MGVLFVGGGWGVNSQGILGSEADESPCWDKTGSVNARRVKTKGNCDLHVKWRKMGGELGVGVLLDFGEICS